MKSSAQPIELKQWPLSILFFLLIVHHLSAQRNLNGILVDEMSGDPISFAHIFLKNDQSHGVISNEKGEYQLSFHQEQLNDTLTISLLGY
ncbi:MAG: carboxypeptidase-like regulatory domain-containing protein, partial [Bacteroidota bacterium]